MAFDRELFVSSKRKNLENIFALLCKIRQKLALERCVLTSGCAAVRGKILTVFEHEEWEAYLIFLRGNLTSDPGQNQSKFCLTEFNTGSTPDVSSVQLCDLLSVNSHWLCVSQTHYRT